MGNEQLEVFDDKQTGVDFWKNKLTKCYLVALVLQILFMIMQFVPIMTATQGELKVSFTEVVLPKTKKYSLVACNGANMIVAVFAAFGLFFRTIPYFIAHYANKTSKPKTFKLANFFCVVSMVLCVAQIVEAAEVANSFMEQGGQYFTEKLFAVEFGAYLYFIIGVALFIVQHIISVDAKNKRIVVKAERLQKEGKV